MPKPTVTDNVEKNLHIKASPDVVFRYFTEADKLARWLCSEATTDPRPGGINHQTHPGDEAENPDGPYLMRGEFIEVDFPTRVVFTWGYENTDFGVPPGTTTVTVDLTASGSGTDLRLTHSNIPIDRARDSFDHGWDQMLGRLATLEL